MKKSNIILFIAFLFLSCGDSKEDINSRIELSSIIRQLNTIYRDFKDNKGSEKQLTILKVRDYYSEYSKQFRDVRQKLAAITITPRFEPLRNLSDSIIAQSADFINHRQTLMVKLFDISNNMSRFKDYCSSSKKYKFKKYSHHLYYDYKIKALEEHKDYIINRLYMKYLFFTQDSISHRMLFYADSMNNLVNKMKFTDTLSFQSIVLDTTDFMHTICNGLKDYDLPEIK